MKDLNSIINLVGENKLEDAINELKLHSGTGYFNEVIQIESRYNELKRKERLGIADNMEFMIERNKVSNSILEIISMVEKTNSRPPGRETLNNLLIEEKIQKFEKSPKPQIKNSNQKYFSIINSIPAGLTHINSKHDEIGQIESFSISPGNKKYIITNCHNQKSGHIWSMENAEFISSVSSEFGLEKCTFYTEDIIVAIENKKTLSIFREEETLDNEFGIKYSKEKTIYLPESYNNGNWVIYNFKLFLPKAYVFLRNSSTREFRIGVYKGNLFSEESSLCFEILSDSFYNVKEIKFTDATVPPFSNSLGPTVLFSEIVDGSLENFIKFNDVKIKANDIAYVRGMNNKYVLGMNHYYQYLDLNQEPQLEKIQFKRPMSFYIPENDHIIASPHYRLIASASSGEIGGISRVAIWDVKDKFRKTFDLTGEIKSLAWSTYTYHGDNPTKLFGIFNLDDDWTGRLLIVSFKEGKINIIQPETGELIAEIKNLHPKLVLFEWLYGNKFVYADRKGFIHILKFSGIET